MKTARGWLFATAVAVASSSAVAGDIASFQPIGFSADGKVFAFEEYGVQAGSGFPYSNIYFIDTDKDQFLPGTPFKVRIDDEKAGLAKARTESVKAAGSGIEKYGFNGNPGLLAAFNPVSEVGSPLKRIRYLEDAADPAVGKAYTLLVQEVPLAAPDACRSVMEKSVGFRLQLIEKDGGPAHQSVHEDTNIPESRGCPVSYRIGGVMTFHPQNAASVHVAMVLVLGYGFEGQRNGRWIAVPVHP